MKKILLVILLATVAFTQTKIMKDGKIEYIFSEKTSELTWTDVSEKDIQVIATVDGKLDLFALPTGILNIVKEKRWQRKSDNTIMPANFSPIERLTEGYWTKSDSSKEEADVYVPPSSKQDTLNYIENYKLVEIDVVLIDKEKTLVLLLKSIKALSDKTSAIEKRLDKAGIKDD